MVKILTIFTFSFFFFLLSLSLSQTNWIKHPENPVLAPGLPGEWDGYLVWFPKVVSKDDGYHLWYCIFEGVSWDTTKIGYATSPDGINWTKYNDSTTTTPLYLNSDPVKLSSGPPGDWDHYGTGAPTVLWSDSDSLFHLWYTGHWDILGNGHFSIGYATSPDGIHWTKYNDTLTTTAPYRYSDPVLDVGLPGEWDAQWVIYPSVLKVGNVFHMYYLAWSGLGQISRVGHATSDDGITWHKDPANPVLSPWPGTWDFPDVRTPTVLYTSSDSMFHMWYSGGIYYQRNWQVGYATSRDGSIWEKDTLNNPVLTPGPTGSWDANSASQCIVLIEHPDSALKMWYTGLRWNSFQDLKIGYATNPLCRIQVTPEAIAHALQPGITIMDSLVIENTGNPLANDLIFHLDSSSVDWLNFQSSPSDTLSFGEISTVYFRINTTALPPDSHRTNITIKSNDFFWSRKKIPVQLEVVSGLQDNTALPLEFSLKQNYPNPFNPRTTIAFRLPQTGEVTLKIYNILGEEIATLLSASLLSGFHSVEWDASNVASGVYLYRLETDGFVETRKMILMK